MKPTLTWLLGIVIGLISIIVILTGCSQGLAAPNQNSSAPPTRTGSSTGYPPRNFSPEVNGTTISLSITELEQAVNGNFVVEGMPFMAYNLDGKYYVRANICVPCGSDYFTLKNGTLVCGSCGTVFNATTGAGMRGAPACMTFTKKAVAYTTDGGSIVMNLNDLTKAFQDTLYRRS